MASTGGERIRHLNVLQLNEGWGQKKLHNLWGPMPNANAWSPVQNLLRISSYNSSALRQAGDPAQSQALCHCSGYTPMQTWP